MGVGEYWHFYVPALLGRPPIPRRAHLQSALGGSRYVGSGTYGGLSRSFKFFTDASQVMMRWGNARANKYWEHGLPKDHVPDEARIESFIRSKYEYKKFVRPGPMPEPETLEDGPVAAMPVQVRYIREIGVLMAISKRRVNRSKLRPNLRPPLIMITDGPILRLPHRQARRSSRRRQCHSCRHRPRIPRRNRKLH
jgi:hypothetical protein